ncbi:MotA/TolQ/ExbB proton channel family protein [bacterium]|nr:MotA/TolQ/ExbB proton channel family protein [bacterium]
MFYDRGPTQHAVMLLTFWSLAILGIKWLKLRHQRKMLNEEFLPDRPDFVLGTSNVDTVLDSIHDLIDDPSRFVLTNRIKIALSNLKNLGRVSDVDDIFRSQADTDESLLESTYSILNGFIWAIPVLGFIGTVLGLSESISSFGGVLKDSKADMQAIKSNLTQVTSGLATAFETTLVALVAALIVQLLATFLRKNEQTFLDDCSEYCLRKIVNRIRIVSDQQN